MLPPSKTSKQRIKNIKNHNKSEHSKKKSQTTFKLSKEKSKVEKHTLWWEKRGYVQVMPDSKVAKYITNKKLESTFTPSMNMVIKIMSSIIKKGSETKTVLSKNTNLNYTRLAKHIVWLEKRGLVRSTVKNSKIKIDLTDEGRVFATTITTVLGDTK